MKLSRLALLVLGTAVCAYAESSPQSTLLDNRVRTLVFNENQVYKIVTYYGYQVDIELAANEEVRTVAAGDTVGWQIVSAGQHLFIKPMASNARTNLSVITSKRTYLFDLMSQSVSKRDDMAYLIRFLYPQQAITITPKTHTLPANSATLNFDYKIRGDKAIRPSKVFDDGMFTFFQFESRREPDLPAIYWITQDGQESLVNFRMDNDYMVVERVSTKFVLRSGNDRVTVTNKRRSTLFDELTESSRVQP